MKRRLFSTLVILVIAGVAISGVADDKSYNYAEDALARALATFAVARSLNGVISVAQGTEIALEPGGVGIMLTPGQILDPVNDLIERFSSVMLVAASSLGLQIVLLEILSWWILTALLVTSLIAWLVVLFVPRFRDRKFASMIQRTALVLIVLRFAVPVVIIASNFLFDTFLLTRHDAAALELTTTTAQIEEMSTDLDNGNTDQAATDPGDPADNDPASTSTLDSWRAAVSGVWNQAADWTDGVRGWLGSLSISATYQQLEENAAQATSHIIDLIVIFVLQTILFPVAFLWLFVEFLKTVAARSMSYVGSSQPTKNSKKEADPEAGAGAG
jgi:hypothetical protein